jgi:hypothetical protein
MGSTLAHPHRLGKLIGAFAAMRRENQYPNIRIQQFQYVRWELDRVAEMK